MEEEEETVAAGGGPSPAVAITQGRASSFGEVDVANHYNNFRDRHRTLTSGSDILNLKNLNNWRGSLAPSASTSAASAASPPPPPPGGARRRRGDRLRAADRHRGPSVRDAVNRYNWVPTAGRA